MGMHLAKSTNAFVPDQTNTRLLRDAFGRFTTGVTIVTAAHEDRAIAITANSFSSVSLDPAMALWSVDKNSRRYGYFESADHYAIHVLANDQDNLCWMVAKDAYALNAMELARNDHGVPLLDGCLARFECSKSAMYGGGDHAIMLGNIERAHVQEEGDALAFFKGKMGRFAAH